jgi:hypothetical protein
MLHVDSGFPEGMKINFRKQKIENKNLMQQIRKFKRDADGNRVEERSQHERV